MRAAASPLHSATAATDEGQSAYRIAGIAVEHRKAGLPGLVLGPSGDAFCLERTACLASSPAHPCPLLLPPACSSEGVARLVHEGLLHLLNACLQYCALRKQAAATTAALRALAEQQAGGDTSGGSGSAAAPQALAAEGSEGAGDDNDSNAPADAATAAGLQWAAARRAELQRRAGEVSRALGALRREWGQRHRLLLRVLSTKAAEAGSHADELRQLLGALDYSRWYENSMA